jgi:hypothetical protein
MLGFSAVERVNDGQYRLSGRRAAMPRILVLADCDSQLGDHPIALDEETGSSEFEHWPSAGGLFERVAAAVVHAEEVEQRVAALHAGEAGG